MRILGFVVGMSGFIIAGMAHLPLMGLLSFVVAVTALFLAAPRQSASLTADVVLTDELPAGQPAASGMQQVSSHHHVRGRRHAARHGAAHVTWRALPAHAMRQHRRAMQKEK